MSDKKERLNEEMSDSVKERSDRLLSKLLSRGFTPTEAEAILGNMYAESKFISSERQDTGRRSDGTYKRGEDIPEEEWFKYTKNWKPRGTGLIQWDDRRIALKEFADARGKRWDDEDVQLDFLVHESQNAKMEKASFDKFRKYTTSKQLLNKIKSMKGKANREREKYLKDNPDLNESEVKAIAFDAFVERSGKSKPTVRAGYTSEVYTPSYETDTLSKDDFLEKMTTRMNRKKFTPEGY